MNSRDPRPLRSRREFLHQTTGCLAAGLVAQPLLAAEPKKVKRPKVAAVFTDFRHRLHAHVILENFLEPYYFNGQVTDPGCDVVSFFADQKHDNDMAEKVAKDYKIPLYSTIDQALCLGGNQLAVDAVLCIGEHGQYPSTPEGQVQYPRKRFFDDVVKVFKKSDRVVPIFNDKHLSYRWDWAKEMYDTAREMKIPFMAGSSVPLAQRIPDFELPKGKKIVEAVSIHGGGLDSYDFHGMEVLQSIVEARPGGETGVAKVQYLSGDALWRAAGGGGRFGGRRGGQGGQPKGGQSKGGQPKGGQAKGNRSGGGRFGGGPGLWSVELAEAAMTAEPARGGPTPKIGELFRPGPFGILITYKDGLKAMVLKMGNSGTRWNFACRLEGETAPRTTSFYVGPWENRCLFKALSHAIQTHFREGQAPYPIERTLLTTGLVAAGVESRATGNRETGEGKVIETPHLGLAYQPRDFTAMREMGASWKIITEKTPQPQGICKITDRA